MDDIDLTRDWAFSPKRAWFVNRHGGVGRLSGLELSAGLNNNTGMLQVFLTDPVKEILEPWYSSNRELIKNDFFGFLTQDNSPPVERTCDRCGKPLYPWDMYGLCSECVESLETEKIEALGRDSLGVRSEGDRFSRSIDHVFI